ncbi:Gfo/Idh/MocA family protein [Streptococcus moroccensis]|uniref:Dehydrogenase n=1 Tax=Streptococcus moroccensis TaxID=1451356 RepID=A0ABT9YRS9_9STRE|nr:Gfo/Idh/MocA family oxidoreductase [Streptococcus moroccensis]MDQ0222602.1 putative dehydrogenase [Streptococcus moroccensis]
MEKIKIGIVGTGKTIGIAQMHIGAFKRMDSVEITALYDILPDFAKEYKERFELTNADVCSTYDELLSKVDAVIICTPNNTHVSYAVQAINAGKHVLCEKPFGTSAEDSLRALQYSKLTDKVCMIGFCYRGVPAFRYIKHLIDNKELGEVYYVRQSQGGNRIGNPDVKLEWRMQDILSGPGAVYDFGSHQLDIADWMLQKDYGEIVEVQAMKRTYIKERQEVFSNEYRAVTNDDVCVYNVVTDKGVLISNTVSRIGSETTMEVYGSKGHVIYNATRPFEVTLFAKDENNNYKAPAVVDVPEELYLEDANTPKEPFSINFYLQAKSFVEAIQSGKSFENTFDRGYYIQNLLDYVNESAEKGCTIVIGEE